MKVIYITLVIVFMIWQFQATKEMGLAIANTVSSTCFFSIAYVEINDFIKNRRSK